MYALLFCVAFVVPTLQLPADTKESIMWRAIQKVFLNYAIGFTIAGISSDIMIDMFAVKENGTTGQVLGGPAPPSTIAGGGGGGLEDSTIRFKVLPLAATSSSSGHQPQPEFSVSPNSHAFSTAHTDVSLNLKMSE